MVDGQLGLGLNGGHKLPILPFETRDVTWAQTSTKSQMADAKYSIVKFKINVKSLMNLIVRFMGIQCTPHHSLRCQAVICSCFTVLHKL